MGRFILFALLFFNICAAAQPVWLLHKPYAAHALYIDSLTGISNNIRMEESMAKITEIENWAEKNQDPEFAAQLKLLKYRLMIQEGTKESRINEKTLYEFAAYARDNHLYYVEADIIKTIGDYFNNFQKNGAAFENYLSAYNIYSKFTSEDFPPKHEYLYALGIAYLHYGDNENAIKFLKEAQATKSLGTDKYSSPISNALGVAYRNLYKYDSAEWYFRKIYEQAIKSDDRQWMGISTGNIGICYYFEHRYKEAIPLLETDVETSLATSQIKNAVGSMYILADIYFLQKDYTRSEALLHKAINIAESGVFRPDYSLAVQLFTLYSKVYFVKNDMRDAYLYADSALGAKDSFISQYNALNLVKAKERVGFVQHKLEEEELGSQKKIQLLIRDCLVGGIFLLMVIGILFINRQRLKRKKLEAEKRSAEAELANSARLLERFRQTMQEKNSIIERFTIELDRIKEGEDRQADNNLRTELERSVILTDQQWDDFRVLFEQVHKGFFASLKKKMPDLTQAEIRFLALTKLKLSSKEMAAMLGISTNAIRIYRHRLRRKLALDKEDMIEELVADI